MKPVRPEGYEEPHPLSFWTDPTPEERRTHDRRWAGTQFVGEPYSILRRPPFTMHDEAGNVVAVWDDWVNPFDAI